MNPSIRITGPAGRREFSFSDLPLSIGSGVQDAIRIPGPVSAGRSGSIGALDGRPFLQPEGGRTLAVNGEPVTGTRWLEDGDVVTCPTARIECHLGPQEWLFSIVPEQVEYDTLPPGSPELVAAAPVIEPVARKARAASAPQQDEPTARSRLRRNAFIPLLVLSLAVVVYLFVARAVRVEVEPGDADVTVVGGLLHPRFGERYLLWPGEYRVLAKADGYRTAREPIRVTDEPSQLFRFELQKLPGHVVVDNDRGVPAAVSIDGVEVGTTPTPALELAAGEHRLQLEAERYLPLDTHIDVTGLGQRQEITVQLQPAWADVQVDSKPPGAQVFADDQPLGETPATVPVPAGTHELKLRLEGYKPWIQTLTVEAGQQIELPLVNMQPADGVLSVVTTPADASVSVDGRYRGRTPVDVELSPGRRHDVIVSKPGFDTVKRTIEMQSQGGQTLRLTLEARLGSVKLVVQPEDASLYIDGQPAGPANQELRLPARVHRLEIRKAGYAPHHLEVTPRPGLPQTLEIKLLTEAQAVLAATPRTVTTGQGLLMRLIDPGEFELGAPRRQQGRRPNESQRRVRLTRQFYIGSREITNTEFREFRPQHTSGAEKFRQLGVGDHPAVLLGWDEAVAFCNWLSDRDGLPRAYVVHDGHFVLASPRTTGYRLPTEAEWAWVARYNGGGEQRRFPWGDRMPPAPKSGNYADRSARGIVANVLGSYDDGYPVTAPVQRFKASPLGLFDLGGNVAEWVHDLYTVYPPSTEVEIDPVGPAQGQYHVIRGSGWRHSSISELRFAYRDFGDRGRLDVGFRIARFADPVKQEK